MGATSQPITINLSICAACLSQPQQNIVFQLPPTLGNKGAPIIIQLPAHQTASQDSANPQMVPQIFEGRPDTNASAPAPQIPAQPDLPPHGEVVSSVASLGDECGAGGCNCGPSCQCVGCVVHPYNSATEDFVFSAYLDSMGLADQPGQLWDSQHLGFATPEVASGGSAVDVSWPLDPQLTYNPNFVGPVAEDAHLDDDFLVINYLDYTTYH